MLMRIKHGGVMEIMKYALGAAGICLVVVYASWQVALGVFLLMWANNLDYVRK